MKRVVKYNTAMTVIINYLLYTFRIIESFFIHNQFNGHMDTNVCYKVTALQETN